jgi:hypothetical protein
MGLSAPSRLAGRPPSLASQLLQEIHSPMRTRRSIKQQKFHAITPAMQSGKHNQLFGKQAKGQKKSGP